MIVGDNKRKAVFGAMQSEYGGKLNIDVSTLSNQIMTAFNKLAMRNVRIGSRT